MLEGHADAGFDEVILCNRYRRVTVMIARHRAVPLSVFFMMRTCRNAWLTV